MIKSALTLAERHIAARFKFDLGAGYPIGLAPDWAWAKSNFDCREAATSSPEEAAREALNVRDQNLKIVATFSGSVALQRAISAARAYLLQVKSHTVIITTDPSIDIIAAMARELTADTVVRVKFGLLKTFDDEDCERLCAVISKSVSSEQAAIVVITSPENPTGSVWSADHLKRITDTCSKTKSVLIVDHCFLLAGLHGQSDLNPVWQLVDDRAPVIAVWDTGKTIHLGGSKLGFLLCKCRALCTHIDCAISLIQFSLPSHLSQWITGVLRDPRFPEVIDALRTSVQENQRVLIRAATAAGVEYLRTTAGAFELIRQDARVTDMVGTIPLQCFEEDSRPGPDWRRVALARPVAVFKEAASLLFT